MDKVSDIQFIDMIARGLRLMEVEPDAWLCREEYIPYVDEEGKVFDKPVFYGEFTYDGGWTSMPVFMLPMWLSESLETRYHTRCFLEGCEEEWYKAQEDATK